MEFGEVEGQLLRHPYVKAALVLAHGGQVRDGRPMAYVVADFERLKAMQQEGSHRAGADIVDRWNKLYDLTYSAAPAAPSFVGWNSSYSREAIAEADMQEWLSFTVKRVRALKPRKLLEIGCGVGLLLQHLAPKCSVYVGTDFSRSALARLRQWINERRDLQHVELLHRTATELEEMQPGAFDTVVLNSIVQYFPDVQYLLSVLQQAVRLLSPGGKIFIGDVRHLGLLSTFHGAVQLCRAPESQSVGELRRHIARAVAQETELVIDPRFFQALLGRIPGISVSDVQLRRGRTQNELTRYRYDVVLSAGEQVGARSLCEHLVWDPTEEFAREFEAALDKRLWHAIHVTSIPNPRLARDAAARRLILESDSHQTVGVLRHRLEDIAIAGVGPEEFWQWGESYGYNVAIGWDTPPEYFEAQLSDQSRTGQVSQVFTNSTGLNESWSEYVNDPLKNSIGRHLVLELAEFLKGRVPECMIPSEWTILTQFQLTADGRIDPGAL